MQSDDFTIPDDYWMSVKADRDPFPSGPKQASAMQVGGTHYTTKAVQPWDYTLANNLDYFQGTIVKYITRWKDKNGLEDLYKARHFLDKYIEHYEKHTF